MARPRWRRWLLLALASGLGFYLLLLVVLFFNQRRLIFPSPVFRRNLPAGAVQTLEVPIDGANYPAIYLPAEAGQPTLVFFHGNGEQIADGVWLAQQLKPHGLGFFEIEYPGYPGAPGEPSESAFYKVAFEGLEYLEHTLGVQNASLVMVGQSIGTGTATEMAVRGFGRKLLLISPFTSLPDAAHHHFPFVPSTLVRDQFDSGRKAPGIGVPTLVIHGTDDEVVPFVLGEALSHRFPKGRLMRVEGGHHNDLLDRPEVLSAVVGFVSEGG